MAFSDLGILPQSSSGSSSSTHFCDGVITAMDGTLKMAFLGGSCADGVHCGAFACALSDAVAASYWNVGASPQTNTAPCKKRKKYKTWEAYASHNDFISYSY